MWYWRNVANAGHGQARALQGADGCFPAGTGAFNVYVNLPQAHVHAPASGLLGSALSGEGGTFAGAFEAHSAGTGRGNYVAVGIGNADHSIVESRIDVRSSMGDSTTFSTARSRSRHMLLLTSSAASAAGNGASWSFAGASVGACSLAVNG